MQMQNAPISANPLSVMTAVNFSESKISTNPSEMLVAFSIQTVGQEEANV